MLQGLGQRRVGGRLAQQLKRAHDRHTRAQHRLQLAGHQLHLDVLDAGAAEREVQARAGRLAAGCARGGIVGGLHRAGKREGRCGRLRDDADGDQPAFGH
jgi:hypothetical protein